MLHEQVWHGKRIIPARAGFTAPKAHAAPTTTDHPRSRGVYAAGGAGGGVLGGSSPLARGLRRGRKYFRREDRIIPARAGFTRGWRSAGRSLRDHPRSRGVYGADDGLEVRGWGSSPLARVLPPPPLIGRIEHLDHPRSRGVYVGIAGVGLMQPGSSPLARGLRWRRCRLGGRGGIIPARAGFTGRCRSGCGCGSWDHPRSRGVYAGHDAARCGRPGSSPLARGLHSRGDLGHAADRIIPARAGFTTGRSRGASQLGSSPLARGLPGPPR